MYGTGRTRHGLQTNLSLILYRQESSTVWIELAQINLLFRRKSYYCRNALFIEIWYYFIQTRWVDGVNKTTIKRSSNEVASYTQTKRVTVTEHLVLNFWDNQKRCASSPQTKGPHWSSDLKCRIWKEDTIGEQLETKSSTRSTGWSHNKVTATDKPECILWPFETTHESSFLTVCTGPEDATTGEV